MRLRLFFVAVLSFVMTAVSAQEMPKIPVDQTVRMGKLSNGLTYFIKHNNWPEHVANFYIAQRVGSIQEDESQRGLAHFLEHMAFNGTKHYPDSSLLEYTRSLGVDFGGDLNAYTAIDRTVYRICDVPTKRQSALDSCLLILRDWSTGLTLDGKEIDKERGVIHQEWQLDNSGEMRIFERVLPQLYLRRRRFRRYSARCSKRNNTIATTEKTTPIPIIMTKTLITGCCTRILPDSSS